LKANRANTEEQREQREQRNGTGEQEWEQEREEEKEQEREEKIRDDEDGEEGGFRNQVNGLDNDHQGKGTVLRVSDAELLGSAEAGRLSTSSGAQTEEAQTAHHAESPPPLLDTDGDARYPWKSGRHSPLLDRVHTVFGEEGGEGDQERGIWRKRRHKPEGGRREGKRGSS